MKFVTDIRQTLEEQLKEVKKSLTIITGFVTMEGFQFVEELVAGQDIEKKILFKLTLKDFQRGASSFDFHFALERGWSIYYDNTIHAKNYIFDDQRVIQGSSNLTSNGLGLQHERCDDNNVLWEFNDEFRGWVVNKFYYAIQYDTQKAHESQKFLNELVDYTPEMIQTKQEAIDRKLEQHRMEVAQTLLEVIPGKKFSKSSAAHYPLLQFLRKNLQQLAEVIDADGLNTHHHYVDNQDWYDQSYIIPLDQDIHDFFNFKNHNYLYTPRIYRYKGSYYRERLFDRDKGRNHPLLLRKIIESLHHLTALGIEVDVKSFRTIQEGANLKIKYRYFWPLTSSSSEVVYQQELMQLFPKDEVETACRQMEGIHE